MRSYLTPKGFVILPMCFSRYIICTRTPACTAKPRRLLTDDKPLQRMVMWKDRNAYVKKGFVAGLGSGASSMRVFENI